MVELYLLQHRLRLLRLGLSLLSLGLRLDHLRVGLLCGLVGLLLGDLLDFRDQRGRDRRVLHELEQDGRRQVHRPQHRHHLAEELEHPLLLIWAGRSLVDDLMYFWIIFSRWRPCMRR